MKPSKIAAIVAVAMLVLATPRCWGWHERGHMSVALLAYRQLDATQQKKIQEILKQHPHFAEFLSAGKPTDAPADEWLVMQAAIWPDWIRFHHQELSRPLHHFQDLPVKRLDGASESERATIETNSAAGSGQLFQELKNRVDELQNGSTEAKQRAMALCWILHQIGDIHQPLHAASLFSKDSLQGDRGGNNCYVPWDGRPQVLHSIWDGVIGWDEFVRIGQTEYGVVDLMVRDFQHRYPVTAAERAVAKVEDWAEESHQLADKEVYSFQGTPIPMLLNFDHHPHIIVSTMVALPTGYRENAARVAEKRVTLAGYRLADQLKAKLP